MEGKIRTTMWALRGNGMRSGKPRLPGVFTLQEHKQVFPVIPAKPFSLC